MFVVLCLVLRLVSCCFDCCLPIDCCYGSCVVFLLCLPVNSVGCIICAGFVLV